MFVADRISESKKEVITAAPNNWLIRTIFNGLSRYWPVASCHMRKTKAQIENQHVPKHKRPIPNSGGVNKMFVYIRLIFLLKNFTLLKSKYLNDEAHSRQWKTQWAVAASTYLAQLRVYFRPLKSQLNPLVTIWKQIFFIFSNHFFKNSLPNNMFSSIWFKIALSIC